jgi:hypothetical protein
MPSFIATKNTTLYSVPFAAWIVDRTNCPESEYSSAADNNETLCLYSNNDSLKGASDDSTTSVRILNKSSSSSNLDSSSEYRS